MNKHINSFSEEVRDDISDIIRSGGVLKWQQCRKICQHLSIDVEELMIRLLPVAASLSNPVVSNFKVGAVLRGEIKDQNGSANLYFGANLEFANQALCCTLHAEQSAISNAWVEGETCLTGVAISATPCGHCRQFLYEAVGSNEFPILIPSDDNKNNEIAKTCLEKLLPKAFGPLDLGGEYFFVNPSYQSHQLEIHNVENDSIVSQALAQANLSYAPYTNNFSGCLLVLNNGEVILGRSIENAAYNPSITAMVAVLSKMHLSGKNVSDVKRAILVEQVTSISEKQIAQHMLDSYGLNINLEYKTTNRVRD